MGRRGGVPLSSYCMRGGGTFYRSCVCGMIMGVLFGLGGALIVVSRPHLLHSIRIPASTPQQGDRFLVCGTRNSLVDVVVTTSTTLENQQCKEDFYADAAAAAADDGMATMGRIWLYGVGVALLLGTTIATQRQPTVDQTTRLDDDVMKHILQFVGHNSFRSVAGTCPRFRHLHQEAYGTCTTSAEKMVQTIAGAEFFLRETSLESRFCRSKDVKSSDFWMYHCMRQSCSPLEFVRDAAALHGRLDVLQWVATTRGCPLDTYQTCALAAYSGNLAVFQWLDEKRSPWDARTCAAAASNGQLALLQWARANRCPWDEWTCAVAASKGDLTMLQWARANDCPWDYKTCARAASNGHLAVLEWARANSCPWSEYTCSGAALNGHLTVLQWARTNGCPWNAITSLAAASNGHLSILQWARANGCPWESLSCAEAARNGHTEVLQWLVANGCPQTHEELSNRDCRISL